MIGDNIFDGKCSSMLSYSRIVFTSFVKCLDQKIIIKNQGFSILIYLFCFLTSTCHAVTILFMILSLFV